MNKRVTIYKVGTTEARVQVHIGSGSKAHYTLGKEDYITLKFSTDTEIGFQYGDYIDLNEQQPVSNALSQGLALKFQGSYQYAENQVTATTNSSELPASIPVDADANEDEVVEVKAAKEETGVTDKTEYVYDERLRSLLSSRYKVVKISRASYNTSTFGYDYELRLDAWYYEWNNYLSMMVYKDSDGKLTRNELEWSLTDKLENHIYVILENLLAVGMLYNSSKINARIEYSNKRKVEIIYNEELCKYEFKTTKTEYLPKETTYIDDNTYQMSYSSQKIIDAISSLASKWSCDWWVENGVLVLGRKENENKITEANIGTELKNLTSNNSSGDFGSRIFCFGGTKNMPPTYRKELVFEKTTDALDKDCTDLNRKLSVDCFVNKKYQFTDLTFNQLWTYYDDIKTKLQNGILVLERIADEIGEGWSYQGLQNFYKGWSYMNPINSVGLTKDCYFYVEFEFIVFCEEGNDFNPSFELHTINGSEDSKIKDCQITEFSLIKGFSQTISSTTIPNAKAYVGKCMLGGWGTKDRYPNLKCNAMNGGAIIFKYIGLKVRSDGRKATATAKIVECESNPTHVGKTFQLVMNRAYGSEYNNTTLTAVATGEILYIPPCKYTLDGYLLWSKVPETYYQETESSIINNSISDVRLRMPVETGDYVDVVDSLADTDVVETTKIEEDVYPHRDDYVSSIKTQEYAETKTDAVTGEEYKEYFNAYLIKALYASDDFLSDYAIDGKDVEINFKTGKLAGMTFVVQYNPTHNGEYTKPELNADGTHNADAAWFEIIKNETYGLRLPNDVLCPTPRKGDGTSSDVDSENYEGDKFVLTGYDTSYMVDNMLSTAEKELENRARQEAQKMLHNDSTYVATFLPAYLKDSGKWFNLGDKLKLNTPNYFEATREERIIGYDICLDIPIDSPQFTCGESPRYSRFEKLEKHITSDK